MSTDPTPLTAIGCGLSFLLIGVLWNRRKLNEVRTWAWGRERDETDQGIVGEKRSLDEKIDAIEGKLAGEITSKSSVRSARTAGTSRT
jgi:hypothetical protein